MGLGFAKTLTVIREKLPRLGGAAEEVLTPDARIAKRTKSRKGPKSNTRVLPPVGAPSLDEIGKRTATRRLSKVESLSRTPMLLEVVISGAVAMGGATTSANIGLRSEPSGFANYGNVQHEKKKKSRKKKSREK